MIMCLLLCAKIGPLNVKFFISRIICRLILTDFFLAFKMKIHGVFTHLLNQISSGRDENSSIESEVLCFSDNLPPDYD